MESIKIRYLLLTILILGTACSATGAKPGFNVVDDGDGLEVLHNNTRILRYNYKPYPAPKDANTDKHPEVYNRTGFIHPVWAPNGAELTRVYPKDHIHHMGLWHPWTHTKFDGQEIDFWNLKKAKGTVRFKKLLSSSADMDSAEFQTLQEHVVLKHPDGEKCALNDVLHVRVSKADSDGYIIDYKTTQKCASDIPLELEKYRYGGFGFRATAEWTGDNSDYLTSEGKTRKDGHSTKARWCIIQGTTSKGDAGILLMSHPDNHEHPEPVRIWPSAKNGNFFNFCPIQDKPWTLKPGNKYTLKYRIHVYDGKMSAETAEQHWKSFVYPEPVVAEVLDISDVPADFPVGFCLMTRNKMQFAAYYDAERRMTVASRFLDEKKWKYQVLPSNVGWDSHNYVTMTADDDGYIHLSGNMHNDQLVYFRTKEPWDISTFEAIHKLIGKDEDTCTYPVFMRGPNNKLMFHYRNRYPGRGYRKSYEVYNVYDSKTKKWHRFLDTPFLRGDDPQPDGTRLNSYAYQDGPYLGPDGYYHLCWVWRDRGGCQTNHDPSYSRSRDLKHWETIAGKPIELPITYETPGLIIDPIPIEGGILNGSQHTGFDNRNRPVITYYKFDEEGNNQAYAARFEDGKWNIRQISNWNHRWDFRGGGAITVEIILRRLQRYNDSHLAQPYWHIKYGSGLIIIDDESLEPVSVVTLTPPGDTAPAASCGFGGGTGPYYLQKPESDWEEMNVHWASDTGDFKDDSAYYVLRWETLPANRDKRPKGPLPKPGKLRVYKLVTP